MSRPNSELKDLAERAPFGSGILFASTRKRAELNRQACTFDVGSNGTYYTCDGVGNVTAIVDPLQQPSCFAYDPLGRALWARNPLSLGDARLDS